MSGANVRAGAGAGAVQAATSDIDFAALDTARFTPAEVALVRSHLLEWFAAHRRALPWRGDAPPYGARVDGPPYAAGRARSAYGTWVSEIMLQQTRVDAVCVKFDQWMTSFPTPAALAAASADAVNAAWAGLGYYRRARLLHEGAAAVVARHGGAVPSTAAALLELPGVGDYTAGAIASIAFGESAAIVDGNVARVLARLRALPVPAAAPALRKAAWRLSQELVPPRGASPGDFNEALMELGATVCAPRAPKCAQCPVRAQCASASAAPADVEDVGVWIAARFPAAAESKKAVPVEAVSALVIERAGAGGFREFLFVRKQSGSSARSGANGSRLLEGQWQPITSSCGAQAVSEKARPKKRARGADAAPPNVLPDVARICEALGVPAVILLHGAPSFAAASDNDGTSVRLRVVPDASGHVAHVFSHVRIEADVTCFLLESGSADPASSLAAAGNVETRWVRIKDFEQLGLTTFAVKLLFPTRSRFPARCTPDERAAIEKLEERFVKSGMIKQAELDTERASSVGAD